MCKHSKTYEASADTLVQLFEGDDTVASWEGTVADFVEANDDIEEYDVIRSLRATGCYVTGGGASPRFELFFA